MKQVFARLLRSWFELTEEEQKAVIIILALFMLGLAVRYWHLEGQKSEVRDQRSGIENLTPSGGLSHRGPQRTQEKGSVGPSPRHSGYGRAGGFIPTMIAPDVRGAH